MRQLKTVKISKIVSHNVAVLRGLHKLSVIDLAKKCNVSRQAIYHIESGTHIPTPKLAEALAKAFKIDEHELFQIDPKFTVSNK